MDGQRRVEPRVLKGFRDYMPDAEAPRAAMLETAKGVFQSFGYGPLQTPALEYAEILLGKYGDEGDKLLYRFLDNGERDVALRYDLTVPLARVVAQNAGALTLPWRRYQVAPVWRAEKPARGRFREFVQCDVDLIGEGSVAADAEIMMVGLGVLGALGVPDYVMRVNDRRILDGILDTVGVEGRERRLGVLRAVDKLAKIGRDAVVAEIVAGCGLEVGPTEALLALLGRKVDGRAGLQALEAELAGSEVGRVGLRSLSELLEIMEKVGLSSRVEIDLTIARGLDYYTATIYETFLVGHEGFGSVMSGGRYDGLMDMFQAKPSGTPAVGISLGVDRLLAALIELGLVATARAPADACFCLFDAKDFAEVAKTAAALRAQGVSVEVGLSAAKLGKQFQVATKKGYRWALLQGERERDAGTVLVKDLVSGVQEELPLGEVARRVSGEGDHGLAG